MALLALPLSVVYQSMPQNWLGVAGMIIVGVAGGVLLHRASRTRRWGPTHIAVAGAAPLLVTAALAFTYDPLIGEVSAAAKYGHNAVMVTIVLLTLLVAILRRQPRSAGSLVTDVDEQLPLAR